MICHLPQPAAEELPWHSQPCQQATAAFKPRVIVRSLTSAVFMTTIVAGSGVAAVGTPKTIVEVQRGGIYDACFVASVGQDTETATTMTVRIVIDHKQNSGRCGCKSAELKVLVSAKVPSPTPLEARNGGLIHVQTTRPFSNSLTSYELNIKKRLVPKIQNSSIWLTCAV
jgi:hypothetical protein